jgi:hypothetical protein
MNVKGEYLGKLVLELLPDGRRMRLFTPFGFRDKDGKEWKVPADAVIDGASIPAALWSLSGGPYEGKYRDASVIHDWYCSIRTEPWEKTHRVFYEAMLVSGVSERRAKLMYLGVRFGGPRWSSMDSENAQVSRRIRDSDIMFSQAHNAFEIGCLEAVEAGGKSAAAVLSGDGMYPTGTETRLHITRLKKLIDDYSPSLDDIDKALEDATSIVEPTLASDETRPRIVVLDAQVS